MIFNTCTHTSHYIQHVDFSLKVMKSGFLLILYATESRYSGIIETELLFCCSGILHNTHSILMAYAQNENVVALPSTRFFILRMIMLAIYIWQMSSGRAMQ